MSVKVVLDMTSIREIKGRLLEGPEVDLLRNGIERLKIELFVPRVVLREAANQFRVETRKRLDAVNKALSQLDNYLPSPSGVLPVNFDVDAAVTDYSNRLSTRLNQLGATILEFDDIPHDAILSRVIEKRKPFDEHGRGFQDALIWESILRKVASPAIDTVFITNNSGDFLVKGSGVIHADLLADLTGLALPGTAVTICKSISNFNELYIVPKLESVQEAAKSPMKDWSFKGFTLSAFYNENREGFSEEVTAYADGIGEEISSVLLNGVDVTNVYLESLGDPYDVVANSVVVMDHETVGTILHLRLEAVIQFDIHKSDYSLIENEDDIKVVNRNLNEHMMTVSLTFGIDYTIDLALRASDGDLESWGVSNFDLGIS